MGRWRSATTAFGVVLLGAGFANAPEVATELPPPWTCNIIGTNGDDFLEGTDGPDVICGFRGNDIINGLGGDDVIYGGPGHDSIQGGDGSDIIYGEDGNDTLSGNAGSDRIWGGRGEDLLYAASADLLNSDSSPNLLGGGPGWDHLSGSAGDDILYLGTDGGVASGNAGDDRLIGPSGAKSADNHVVMFGGPGDDLLIANRAGEGSGRDVPELTPQTSDRISNYLNGGGGNDRVYGSPWDDYIENVNGFVDAKEGNDTMIQVIGLVLAGEGNDYVSGTDGFGSEYIGGAGDDQLFAPGDNSTLRGGLGADKLTAGDFSNIEIWPGTDEDIDQIIDVNNADRCRAGANDVVIGLCTP